MEVIIEKADGTPVSSQDAEMLLKYLKDRYMQRQAEKQEHDGVSTGKEYEIEILIEEDSSNVYALAICPGIRKEQIEIKVDDDMLSISTKDADKKEISVEEGGRHFHEYIDRLKYHGECELPTEIIPEEAEADLENGILYLTMPKPEAVKPKMIPVK
ncbi:MAG: Hsp20/alpha crystallin family protein [Anaerolineaceae bacterium]|nr:Hsp20/alpha crystallin family protein [Anaerolineaceae bacterium]